MENQAQNQTVMNIENELSPEPIHIGDVGAPNITMKFPDTITVTNETNPRNTVVKNVSDDGDKQIVNDISDPENVPENTELFESLQDKLNTFKDDFLALVDVLQEETLPNDTEDLVKPSLSLLADYGNSSTDDTSDSDSEETDSSGSSSDTDTSCPVISNINGNGDFRSIAYPNNTDSSSSSSSSDDEDEVDVGSYDSDSSDNASVKIVDPKPTEKNSTPRQPIRNKKGDLQLCDLPPIENLQISVPESDCVEFGKVVSIVEEQVVISALPNMPPLDIDTVLFLNKGDETLGKIFDIFGPVNHPMYTVRFNNKDDILNKNVKVGTQVYCAPTTEHTSYVLVADLMKVKGSDASWKEDLEPPAHLLEFSDDEEERRMRAKRKNKQQHNAADDKTEQTATKISDFEKRKNERNLYLNNRFNNKKKMFNQNSVRPRGFDFTLKWTDHPNRGNVGPQPPFRPRQHWWGDGSGPSTFMNPACQPPMYHHPHHPYFGGNPVFQHASHHPYGGPVPFPPQTAAAASNVASPRPDFNLFVAPFHFQQTQMLPPPPPPPPKQNKPPTPPFNSNM